MNITSKEDAIPLTPQAFQVLVALAERPMYGRGIIEQCQADSEGLNSLDPGTVYRILRRLQAMHFIHATFEATSRGSAYPRTYFELAPAGRLALKLETDRYRPLIRLAQARLDRSATLASGRRE